MLANYPHSWHQEKLPSCETHMTNVEWRLRLTEYFRTLFWMIAPILLCLPSLKLTTRWRHCNLHKQRVNLYNRFYLFIYLFSFNVLSTSIAHYLINYNVNLGIRPNGLEHCLGVPKVRTPAVVVSLACCWQSFILCHINGKNLRNACYVMLVMT
jgi:hypothetical protein